MSHQGLQVFVCVLYVEEKFRFCFEMFFIFILGAFQKLYAFRKKKSYVEVLWQVIQLLYYQKQPQEGEIAHDVFEKPL